LQKLYCYIDETGQDTRGDFFLVAAVITGSDRDEILPTLERIEQVSGKGKVKWIRSRDTVRRLYLESVLASSIFSGHLLYAIYRNTIEYPRCLAETTSRAVARFAEPDYKATIIVDGLEGRQKQLFTNHIRSLGVRHKTVRGVRDETDAFIRLADAVCGFARAGLSGHMLYAPMLRQAEAKSIIVPL
jgi:hypothetical protein